MNTFMAIRDLKLAFDRAIGFMNYSDFWRICRMSVAEIKYKLH